MDRYHKVRAFVLAVQRREKDISATLFTLEKGKISFLAKGARTLSSHRLAALQTGYEISAQLYQKNEYFWLSEAQTITPFLPKNSLGQLSLLFFFSELLFRLLPWEEIQPQIYPLARLGFRSLEKGQVKSFLKTQINLLQILGFGVGDGIIDKFNKGELQACQLLLKQQFEEILEGSLKSLKAFQNKI